MRVYVAKILIEGRNYTTCNVKVSQDLNTLKKYASDQMDAYVDAGGNIVEKSDLKYVMMDSTVKVTITIEGHDI